MSEHQEAKEVFQSNTWRESRSLRDIRRSGNSFTPPPFPPPPISPHLSPSLPISPLHPHYYFYSSSLGEANPVNAWHEGKAQPHLGELVWMEISIPAIARQLRVQYPLSTTIGQIKNYLKTQFAEEMQVRRGKGTG